uniref:N-acetyllactosaminide beta-1,3-N-acetylglucosaminyltransferase n=1 Tax=Strongyloides stercoralis TaxID=6248 RepID=A0A0K0EIU6_STRER
MTKLRNFFNLQFIYYLFLFSIVIIYVFYTSTISNIIIPKIVDQKDTQTEDVLFTTYKEYLILPYAIKNINYNYSDNIVLILHVSNDQNLTKIENHLKNWDGFISLSIFINITSNNFEELTCTYCKLISIIKKSKKIDIHFIVKINSKSYSIKNLLLFKEPYICNNFNYSNDNVSCYNNYDKNIDYAKRISQYPINILRNIARKYSHGKYIVIADMDHMFSKDFHKKMLLTAKRELRDNVTAVLVYRIFEVDYKDLKYGPKNKKELKKMMDNKKAFIFHHYFNGAHNISKLNEWFSIPDSKVPTIQHEELFNRYNWEPQFVSLSNIPYHDERFPYPICDNINLRWTLCMEGYKFLIVNDVFMYHLGLKNKNESKNVNKAKRYSQAKYQKALGKFRREMKQKYLKNTNICRF